MTLKNYSLIWVPPKDLRMNLALIYSDFGYSSKSLMSLEFRKELMRNNFRIFLLLRKNSSVSCQKFALITWLAMLKELR